VHAEFFNDDSGSEQLVGVVDAIRISSVARSKVGGWDPVAGPMTSRIVGLRTGSARGGAVEMRSERL